MPATAVAATVVPQGVATPNSTGVAVDITNGNKVTGSDNDLTVVRFTKTDAGVCTVSVTITRKVAGQTVSPLTFTIPATTGDVLYPLGAASDFGDAVTFTYAGATAGTKIFPYCRT